MLFMKESNAFSYEYLIKDPPPPCLIFLPCFSQVQVHSWAEGARLAAVPSKKPALHCDLLSLRGLTLPLVAI